MDPVSHPDAYFTCEEGQANINLKYPSSTQFMIKMHFMDNKDGQNNLKEQTEFTFIEQEENEVCFKVRFPITGMYLIQIYAKKSDSEGNILQYVLLPKLNHPLDIITLPFTSQIKFPYYAAFNFKF